MPRLLRSISQLVRSRAARSDALHELRRRLRGEPGLPEGGVRRVLVICHGNICRSPFAEALLSTRIRGLEVRSAGLQAADGHSADASAAACAERMGISLAAHRSARITSERLAWADLVLVMQGSHAAEVARQWPQFRDRVRLLGDFLDEPPYGLPDPWGEAEAVFDRVFGRIDRAVNRLIERIERRAD